MKHTTGSLDKAAAYLTCGGEVFSLVGRYPNNVFVVETHPWVSLYLATIGWLPYQRFCAMRRHLKYLCKDKDGIPQRYVEKPKGFLFKDLAIITNFSRQKKQQTSL